jgi:hypothetical protein
MSAYTNQQKTKSAKRNSWRKSTLPDHCTLRRNVSKNYRITAAQVTAGMNIHLKDPASTKTVNELHKSNIQGLQLLNL